MKVGQRQYGELAPRSAVLNPWSEVHVDSIGPWTVKVNGQTLKFHALTMLEPVFNLLEIEPTVDSTSKAAAEAFRNCYLSRYPRPSRCVHDNGPEFKADFQDLLVESRIHSVPVTPHTPTTNGLIEATHKAIAQVIRTLVAATPPTNLVEAHALTKHAFATAMHASRCASNQSLGNFAPGALAFRRDMHLDIPLITDILVLQKLRQAKIDDRLLRANAQRISHDYAVNENVFKRVYYKSSDKAKPIYKGPFKITRVHTNNTVTIQLRPGVTERLSIRRLKPQRR